MFLEAYHNNNLVKKENLGLVDGNMNPEKKLQNKKPIPKGVEIIKLADGNYYEDPDSGDLVKIN
jgi:hypothetical protein